MTKHHAALTISLLAVSSIGLAQTPTWTQLTTVASPPARWQHVLSYDLGTAKTVMFGGRDASNAYLDDTWEFDGTTWTQITTTVQPPARWLTSMTYDWVRQNSVLFGGLVGGANGNDTWLWDSGNASWTQAQPTSSPSARRLPAMAFDSARGVVVLFGGNYMNDTWEWDGFDWTQILTANAPSGRETRMAYDQARGRMVMFGGTPTINVYNDETWEYDGTDWIQINPTTSPGARVAAAIEYDIARQRIVMFGGFDQSFSNLDETWEYDGATWTQITPTTSPSARRGFDHTAYDLGQGRVIMFAGYSSGVNDDTWIYEGSTTGNFSVSGPSCSTPSGVSGISGTTPTIGLPLDLTFDNVASSVGVIVVLGLSNQTYLGNPLPFDLGGIGLPGCDLLASADFLDLSLVAGGAATYSLPVPAQPSLVNLSVYCQGIPIDVNPGLVFQGTTSLGTALIGN